MKKSLVFLAGAMLALRAVAQEGDPLAVTLPSGKVIHFETEDQKAKFLAARARAAAPTPTPALTAVSGMADVSLGHTAADVLPQMNGKVNVNAPTFTADYYLFAPETWEGKEVTLSVAYVRRESSTRTDGLVELQANTYGTIQATRQRCRGGDLMIVATPAAAERIGSLAGSRYQASTSGTKTTLFKGTFKKSEVGSKEYYLYVDK